MDETLKCDVRTLPKSAIALDITVPKSVANEIHLKTLAKLAKGAKVPGFRDGKVPPQAVIAKLGLQKVKEATVEQIVDVGMQKSGVGQRVHTVGEARLPEDIENVARRYKVGDELAFTVEVDTYPNVPLDNVEYKGLHVEVEEVPFNQDAYDAALRKLRKQHADIVDQGPEVPSEEGDQLVVNMNGFLATPDGAKGEPLPAVAGGDGITVPLEAGKFMPGLVEGLVGAQVGQKRDIHVTFPPRSSAPQLAGKSAIFEVEVLAVQQRHLPAVGDAFAERVKSDMTWEELDAKLREGVQADADEKLKQASQKAFEKALVSALPADFEVPETMVEQVTKERFAAMLADMRERGTTDEKLKELVTQENYERYKKISRMQVEKQIKGNLAVKAVGAAQGLVVPQNEVDDEVMTLQAQALQRGEKFKESEVRPQVEMQLEKKMVLDWLEAQGSIEVVAAKEFDPAEELGATPEELAAALAGKAAPEASSTAVATSPEAAPTAPSAVAEPAAEPAAEAASEAASEAETAAEAEAATEAATEDATEDATEEVPQAAPPGGFEWGATF